jgi:hypothetical protein
LACRWNVFHIALLHTTESLSTGLSRFHIFQEVLSQPCLNYEDIIVQSRERHWPLAQHPQVLLRPIVPTSFFQSLNHNLSDQSESAGKGDISVTIRTKHIIFAAPCSLQVAETGHSSLELGTGLRNSGRLWL